MSDDARNLAAARAGQHQAFARLYDRHAGVVLSLCRRHATLAEAEDAMQETFLRAYRRLDQLKEPDGFRPWLYAIARRVCSEQRRTQQRRDRREAAAAEDPSQAQPQSPTAAEVLERTEQIERLSAAIDSLKDDERLVIHLHYLAPEPQEQETVSALLGISRSGFYRLLARARRRLATTMRERQPT